MQHYGKKLSALLLALCLIIGFMPMTANAALLQGEDYITQQLYLGEDLVLHLRGDIPADYRDGSTATLTYAGKTDTYTINDLTPDENGIYDLPVELAVPQMTEEINLVLKAKVGLINMEAINETYSIREYLKTLIDGNYTRETKLLAQELLNLGAWAQKYFNYKTDSLANKGYDITVSNPVPAEIPSTTVNGKVDGVVFYGTSVRFLSKTAVRFYFRVNGDVNALTFKADGKTYVPESNGSLYYIEVGGINPQYMNTGINVEVSNGTDALSFTYAPTTYFVRSYHNNADETTKGLMEAAYSYFMEAKEFAGVTDTGALTFQYKQGTANTIQVNTNLPSDIALADFRLTDNNCSVNEDANTKKASNVGMANVDGTIVLTFNFAESFTAGETYSLPKDAFFCFTDNSQYALAQDYIFQFNGTDWTQVQVTGDFEAGIDFEEIGNTLRFSGEGPATVSATVTRVAHNTEVPALANGGDYALKLSHASSRFPTFRINFGKKLEAGTKLSFMAFGIILGDSAYNHSIFEFNDGGDATRQFACGQWTKLTITLPTADDHVDLFWNFDRAQPTDENTAGMVYVDNFVAVEAVEPTGDFLEGVDFETAGNEGLFVAPSLEGNEYRDAYLEKVPYSLSGITAPANGGDYALKLTHTDNYWPIFRINFGTTLEAGTTISFNAYSRDITDSAMNTVTVFEYVSGGDATVEYAYNAWATLTLTLAADSSYVDLVCTMDRWSKTESAANIEVYLDNFKAKLPPVEPTGNALEGYNFETEGHAERFTGISDFTAVERMSYTDAGVAAPANGGSYAVKVSHVNNCWPNFRVDFGQTLKAGTTITFDVYGNYDYVAAEGVNKYFKIELTGDAKTYATSTDPNQVLWTVVDTWRNDFAITLTADSDHLDLFYNVADGGHGDVASWILIDNFKAVEPPAEPTGNAAEGYDFETEGHDLRFTGLSDGAAMERVTYTDAGVAAPANGGTYAVKVSHANNCWPNFRVDFGKTLKAGTTITFDVYGNYDYVAPEGVYKYFKIELTGDAKTYATSTDPNQVLWTVVETWRNDFTITLTADSDHLDLFYNVADGGHGDVASWILIDNFKAVEPMYITDGYDFEEIGNENAFSGLSDGIAMDRVSYADAGVAAPANGGSYALKVSHANECWPNFRVDFGKTLKAGTTITFDVYGNYDYVAPEGVYKYFKIELTGDAKTYATHSDPKQVVWTVVDTWNTGVTITLTADSDHLDLFYNVADGTHGDVASYILIDNLKAEVPVATIADGLTFDDSREISWFTGVGGDNAWRDASFEIVSFDGDNALKLTCAASQWPTFRINFGETLPAGTRIWFQAYTNDTTGIRNTVSIFEPVANCGETVQYYHGSWNDLEVTLTADCDHVDLMCNMDRWNEISCSNIEVYIDNIIALHDITAGADFEAPSDVTFFTGAANGNEWRDVTTKIVSKNGSNVLMMTGANSLWPTFKIDFGTTLKAGTTISFDVLSTVETAQEGMSLSIHPLESNVVTDEYGQAVWMLCDEWVNKTITLSADCSGISFYWDASRNDMPEGTVSYVYIDNVVVNPA